MDGISFPSTSKKPAGPKLERKIVEKNRRNRTNALFNTLFSLVPSHHFIPSKKARLNLPDRLEQATSYMVQLKENVDKLKKRKAEAMEANTDYNGGSDLVLPIVKIRDLGLSIRVTLISRTSVHKSFKVSHFLRAIEDEGAEVFEIDSSVVDHKFCHTINAQVKTPRIGVEISRITARLYELIK